MSNYSKFIEIKGKSGGEIYRQLDENLKAAISKFPWLEKSGAKISQSAEEKKFCISSKLFQADIQCQDAGIQVEAKLSLVALAFKGKLDQTIHQVVSNIFGGRENKS